MRHKRKYNYEESDLQIACVEWCDLQFVFKYKEHLVKQEDKDGNIRKVAPLVATPNERQTTPHGGKRMKMMGRRAGFPDLELKVPRGDNSALYIEMKSKTGTMSKNQKHFRDYLETIGKYVVCRSVKEFQDAVIDYMEIKA